MELNFSAHGLNIVSNSHYLAHGLLFGWAIYRACPVQIFPITRFYVLLHKSVQVCSSWSKYPLG